MYLGDTYGKCREDASAWKNRMSIPDAMTHQSSSYNTGAEMSFRRGIGRNQILRIVCPNEESRKALIKHAKQAGIMQVNGVPVDDFVVVCTTLGTAYKKYVKPLGF
jgi:hypothetical protein